MIINSRNHVYYKPLNKTKNKCFMGNTELIPHKPPYIDFYQKNKTVIQTGGIIVASLFAFILGKKSINVFVNEEKFCLKRLLPGEKDVIRKLENKGLSPELGKIFSQIKNIEDKEEFTKQAYIMIGKQMGYNEYLLPELKFINNEDLIKRGDGGFLSLDHCILVYKKNDNSITFPKTRLIEIAQHELEHFEQAAVILRTLGHNALMDAESFKLYTALKADSNSNLCMEFFKKNIEDLTLKDVKDFNANIYSRKLELIEQYLIEDKGKIPAESPLGQKAKEYLNAIENYARMENTGNKKLDDEAYRNYRANLLEQEAHKSGESIKKSYEDFIINLALLKKKLA